VAEGTTSVSGAVFNLAKNLVGAGVLSLPAGLAAFSASPRAIWPAVLLVTLPLGYISAYGFQLIGRACSETGASDYGEAWARTIGRGSSWVVSATVIVECFGGCIAYAMILGDSLSAILRAVLPGAAGPVGLLTSRTGVIMWLSAFVLYPLCCLPDLGALARFSLLGTLGSLFTAAFMVARLVSGSYAPGGSLRAAAPLLPALDPGAASGLNIDALLLVSVLSVAYLAHFNAPQMYAELKGPLRGNDADASAAKLRRFAGVTALGFTLAIVLNALVMCSGFLTFGTAAQGNILNSYAAQDSGAIAARVAVAASVLFGYPLQFVGYQGGLMKVLKAKTTRWRTAALLAVASCGAICLTDLGLFQAFEGALLGSFLTYVAPGLMHLKLSRTRRGRLAASALVVLGCVLGAVGLVVTLRA